MDGSTTLSAVTLPDDAILYAVSVPDLCERVCDAISRLWNVTAAFVLLAEPEGLRAAAAAGEDSDAILRYRFSAGAPDLAGAAFQEARTRVAQHAAEDALVQPWLREGIAAAGAAAAFPLRGSDSRLGVLAVFLASPGGFTDAKLAFFERLANNVAFRLAALRDQCAKDRLNEMIKALSESNEAILRAGTREELYPLVCETAIKGGKFNGITIVLKDPEGEGFRMVGNMSRPGMRPHRPPSAGQVFSRFGLTGQAFFSGAPAISNDYQADKRLQSFALATASSTTKSGAALPLFIKGEPVGALLVIAGERNCFTPEFVELLQRLAANLSFALENFERAEEKAKAEERIRYLATHDNLTDLHNRPMFEQLLEYSIQTSAQFQRQCAVLFIDLDRFKVINDSLGHAAGDALLVEMAGRLRKCVRSSDIVARLGGDEFMVLLNEVSDDAAITAIANALLTAISKPFNLNGHECRVTASIGIAKFPEDATDRNMLMKHADSAMYLAKSEGKNDVRFFSPDQKSGGINRLLIETELRNALERGELCVHYQPKLDVYSRKIAGVEALLRWNHPELGLVPPAVFIPIAEETGQIIAIGRWVLRTACIQAMRWQAEGLPPFSIAVNVSPRQFSDPNLLQDIDTALAVSGLPPGLLQIEITESMVMLNIEQAIKVLDAIQGRGVRLAIDDFGTGYSSMSTLKRFPIDTIKIDRSFVRDLPRNAEDKAIAQAIINMGKALGLTIVAEGVETAEQDDFLRTHLCDEIQGFLFGKPVPPERIVEFL